MTGGGEGYHFSLRARESSKTWAWRPTFWSTIVPTIRRADEWNRRSVARRRLFDVRLCSAALKLRDEGPVAAARYQTYKWNAFRSRRVPCADSPLGEGRMRASLSL